MPSCLVSSGYVSVGYYTYLHCFKIFLTLLVFNNYVYYKCEVLTFTSVLRPKEKCNSYTWRYCMLTGETRGPTHPLFQKKYMKPVSCIRVCYVPCWHRSSVFTFARCFTTLAQKQLGDQRKILLRHYLHLITHAAPGDPMWSSCSGPQISKAFDGQRITTVAISGHFEVQITVVWKEAKKDIKCICLSNLVLHR